MIIQGGSIIKQTTMYGNLVILLPIYCMLYYGSKTQCVTLKVLFVVVIYTYMC